MTSPRARPRLTDHVLDTLRRIPGHRATVYQLMEELDEVREGALQGALDRLLELDRIQRLDGGRQWWPISEVALTPREASRR